MKQSKIGYNDLKNVDKIILTKDMLSQISKYFTLNQYENYVDYDFDCINIEIMMSSKVNIYIKKVNDEKFFAIFFSDEEKLIEFEILSTFDIFFSVYDIVEYESLKKYRNNAEQLVLFTLEWYPKIIFYIQQHSIEKEGNKFENMTFFINTPNNKFLKENKKGKK